MELPVTFQLCAKTCERLSIILKLVFYDANLFAPREANRDWSTREKVVAKSVSASQSRRRIYSSREQIPQKEDELYPRHRPERNPGHFFRSSQLSLSLQVCVCTNF